MNVILVNRIAFCMKLLAVLLASNSCLQAAEFTATASITSDYFWRGYSKSDQQASGQLNIDYSIMSQGSGYYLGTWLASVDYGEYWSSDSPDVEMVLYGGWSQQLTDDLRIDTQLSHYLYDEKLFGAHSDYSEVYTLLHYRDLLTAEISYAPDAYSKGGSAWNSQLTFRYPIHTYIDFSAGAGYFAASKVFRYDYTYWNSGITVIDKNYSLDLRYFGARKSNGNLNYSSYSQYRTYELPFKRGAAVVTLAIGL